MEAEFVKKRLEKDLAELKKMIEKHFEQRKTDEEAITELQTRKGFSILLYNSLFQNVRHVF